MPNPQYPLVSDIITTARGEAAVGSNPISTALQNTALIRRVKDLEAEGISYPNSVGFLGYWFNDREQLIQSKAKTTLQSAISSGATSLTLASGTDFDSPSSDIAAGYIRNGTENYDFFAYEARSSGVLSTVNGIQIDHSASEEVHKIYKLNSDFGWSRGLFRQSASLTFRQMTASRRQIPAGGSYTYKYIESTNYNGIFLIFPNDIGVYTWTFLYQLGPSNPTDLSDRIHLPGVGHGFRYMVEGVKEQIYHDEGESADEEKARAKKMYHLERMLDEFGIEDQSGDQSIFVPDA